MSSGQSDRNGNSVEPGLPNTFLTPKARSRSNVACLTVTVLDVSFACLRDTREPQCLIPSFRVRAGARPGMTVDMLPRGVAFHRGLALGIRGPQLQAAGIVVGVDREFGALEQRLHAAVAQLLRRLAVVQLGGEFDDEGGLQRSVEDQAGIALDLRDVVAIVMDAVAVESQRGVAEQQHRV